MNANHIDISVQFPTPRIEATGRVIANFAWQHLKAATTFRNHVIAIELQNAAKPFGPFFEDLRSYGSACIMSASASLEALINEFFINPNGPLRPKLHDFESKFCGSNGIERKPPLEKYQIALEMLGQSKFEELSAPYHDASALIKLRNALVHYKPIWDPERQLRVDLAEILAGKYDLSPFPDGGADFVTMKSMSAGCTRWVVLTALTFVKEFNARAKLDEQKMLNFWKLDAN